MTELRFRIGFASPFRVSSGYGAPGVDATVDPHDPLPASSLKGVMRATAVELGIASALLDAVFGSPRRESPWSWSSAVPDGGWSRPQAVSRVALDEHHAATADMLVMSEQIAAGAADFAVSLAGRCDPRDLVAHRTLLAVAGQATRSLGGERRRGLGWVQIRCTNYTPTRDDLSFLLGAT